MMHYDLLTIIPFGLPRVISSVSHAMFMHDVATRREKVSGLYIRGGSHTSHTCHVPCFATCFSPYPTHSLKSDVSILSHPRGPQIVGSLMENYMF